MEIELLKIGDLVLCHYSYHTGIGYGKVLKIVDRKTQEEYQSYGPVITGWGEKNSRLDITLQIVGYDMRDGDREDDLGDIVEVSEERVVDPHQVYRVLTEEKITEIKNEWERLTRNKLNFFYNNLNKEPLEGRKSLNNFKF